MADMLIRQQLLLCFIETYTRQQGCPPTIQEMSSGIGCNSKYLVQYHLDRLEKGGYLTRVPWTSRSVRLTDAGKAIAARWELVVVPAPQSRRKAGAA